MRSVGRIRFRAEDLFECRIKQNVKIHGKHIKTLLVPDFPIATDRSAEIQKCILVRVQTQPEYKGRHGAHQNFVCVKHFHCG